MEIREFIRQFQLFDDLGPKFLEKIQAAAKLRLFRKGTTLSVHGTPATSVFIIFLGAVRIQKCLEDGTDITLSVRVAGDLVGEENLANNNKLATNFTALGPTVALEISTASFREILSAFPALMSRCFEKLLAYQGELTTKIEMLYKKNARERIQMTAEYLNEKLADESEDIVMTHAVLASIAGVTRETASRFVRQVAEHTPLPVKEQLKKSAKTGKRKGRPGPSPEHIAKILKRIKELGNISAVAREFKVSDTTVHRIHKKCGEKENKKNE